MEVKAIDYFNPPICESVILVALHSTGESLMGLGAACLRPLPVQLTFNWNLPLEGAQGRSRAALGLHPPSSAQEQQIHQILHCYNAVRSPL